MNLTGSIGLGFVVFSAICLAIFAIVQRRSPFSFRKIPAFSRIQRAVRLLVEDGSRLHFSLGHASMLALDGASALAGLALLRHLGEITSLGDRPPVVTTGNAVLNLLAQDTLRAAHNAVLPDDPFDMTNAHLTGFTPFSYAAGVMASTGIDNISSSVLIGNFGPEVGLLAESASNQGTTVISASDSLTAQAVLYVTSSDMLVGEELFAAGAYNQMGFMHAASLMVQDVLRWLVILALLAGAGLKLVGLL